MDTWPWLAVAGLGALHGLNPAGGWMFVAARGLRAPDGLGAPGVQTALLPLALGHLAAVALVAGVVSQGVVPDRDGARVAAGVLLAVLAWRHGRGCALPRGAGLALAGWSFLMATAHGAGLMLVPALVPLCLSDGPARAITASGSLGLALAAVGLHLAAMLVTTGALAAGVCRGLAGRPRLQRALQSRPAQAAVLLALAAYLVLT